MISLEYKNLAKEALNFALKNGAKDARISIASSSSSTFEYRDKSLDKLQQAAENKMEIELFVNQRYGSYATNRMDKPSLLKFIASAIESTRYLDEDSARVLPDISRCYKGEPYTLNTYDHDFEKISVEQKLELARNTVDEVFGIDPKIISITAEYGDGNNFLYIISSNGFEGETAHSNFYLYSNISMKGEGDARPSSYWQESSLFLNNLTVKGIARKAYEKTLQKLGQTKMASGKYAMLLDNTQSGRLLSPLLSAINGYSLQQKNSFLIDKLGEKIVSNKLNITDDPHLKAAFGARMFDDEGVATKQRKIIENGVLKTYFIDTYMANKMNIEPTISSPSVVNFELGKRSHEEILATVERGIWVTGFNGGNSNGSTGDFSFGIEGFLIEKGKLVKPVNEMNITGNMLTLWSKVLEIGNDPRLNSSRRVPSLLFDDVDFSGS